MYRYITFFLTLIIFAGCGRDDRPEHCKLADKFMNQFIIHAKVHYGLTCYGVGGGFMDQINRFDLSFFAHGKKSKEELRILMVFLMEDFLRQINADEEIRSYLVEFPFKVNNITFRITPLGENGKRFENKGNEKDLLYSVIAQKASLNYSISNEEHAYLQTVFKESYEDALEIVKEQCPDILLLGDLPAGKKP